MARIIGISLFLILFGCATTKNGGDPNVLLKQKLFETQTVYEEYVDLKDDLFKDLLQPRCLIEWEETTKALNARLRKAKNNRERVKIWFALGNCNLVVKDYRKSIYYYDLVLSIEKKNKKMLTVVYGNLGLIHEKLGLRVLSRSYFDASLKYDRRNSISMYHLAVSNLYGAEFNESIKLLTSLRRKFPKSRVLLSTLGVAYFYKNDKNSLKSKVLKSLHEKDIEAVLFSSALKMKNKRGTEDTVSDLKDLDLRFGLLKEFRSYVLENFGIINAKAKI